MFGLDNFVLSICCWHGQSLVWRIVAHKPKQYSLENPCFQFMLRGSQSEGDVLNSCFRLVVPFPCVPIVENVSIRFIGKNSETSNTNSKTCLHKHLHHGHIQAAFDIWPKNQRDSCVSLHASTGTDTHDRCTHKWVSWLGTTHWAPSYLAKVITQIHSRFDCINVSKNSIK